MERRVIRFDRARLDYGGARTALHETSLEIGPGLTLVLGPNGAGKTSLLKLGAGVERPGSGRVFVDGHDLWRDEVASRRRLAYVPEHPDVTPYASLGEVMRLVCRLRGVPLDRGEAVLARVGLEAEADRTIRELSMGQRRRALVAAAFIGDSTNVLLDEPLEGMDRAMQESIVAWVRQLATGGVTVLVASHEIDPFAALAKRAVGVTGGRVTLVEPLPVSTAERFERLMQLARGEA